MFKLVRRELDMMVGPLNPDWGDAVVEVRLDILGILVGVSLLPTELAKLTDEELAEGGGIETWGCA